mgnify:CR=1 FL=1
MKAELLFFWIAVGLYGLSTFCYIFGFIANYDKLFRAGLFSALAGFIPHVVAIAMRWSASGAGVTPFISISESLSLGVFMTVLIFLISEFTLKKVLPLGVLVMPVAFVLLGWAGTLLKEVAATIAPALQSGWIWVHITGATIGFASVLLAAGMGFLYLYKQKNDTGLAAKLPELRAWDFQKRFHVRYGDIDVNLHVTNTSYVTWALEVAPRDVFRSSRAVAVEVQFLAETHYGSAVLSRLARTGEHTFSHAIVREEDERELARVVTAWEPRAPGRAPAAAGP